VKAPPPYDIEHTPALLTYLQRHRQPGDVVYVFPLSRIGVLFYGPRLGLQPTPGARASATATTPALLCATWIGIAGPGASGCYLPGSARTARRGRRFGTT